MWKHRTSERGVCIDANRKSQAYGKGSTPQFVVAEQQWDDIVYGRARSSKVSDRGELHIDIEPLGW